ncbi:hypothetical protein QWY28_17275 [Nocardioides sp. SOB77]|uniref:Tetracycline repressor TetR C-terminal domain-containing protein n=1 Tax=Nocardioides oceani TaxID=3058369 RepID=A0ABT8FJM9_9ACTN|nr:hypothetical protein [Nocardioides oceani]MDN4174716.1 hypothetical protein [Nocardioides oceani]
MLMAGQEAAQAGEKDVSEHPHIGAVRAYLDNAGITPEALRYAATHEALFRSFVFDLLTGLADTIEAEDQAASPAPKPPVCGQTYRDRDGDPATCSWPAGHEGSCW